MIGLDSIYAYSFEEHWQDLKNEDDVFDTLRNRGTWEAMDGAQKTVVEQTYANVLGRWSEMNRKYQDFQSFYDAWCASTVECPENAESVENTQTTACNPTVFNARRRVYETRILRPSRSRGAREEFDAFQFISRMEEGFKAHPLNVDTDEADDDFLDSHEDQARVRNQADHALRKIARNISILNQTTKTKVMDIQSERRIQ